MAENSEQKPTELLIRLDERFTSFEKTFPMMFDELMVKHKEVLHELEKKADMIYVTELDRKITRVAKNLKENKEETDTKMSTYDKLIWKGTGALMVSGFIGGIFMTLFLNKLQDII